MVVVTQSLNNITNETSSIFNFPLMDWILIEDFLDPPDFPFFWIYCILKPKIILPLWVSITKEAIPYQTFKTCQVSGLDCVKEILEHTIEKKRFLLGYNSSNSGSISAIITMASSDSLYLRKLGNFLETLPVSFRIDYKTDFMNL